MSTNAAEEQRSKIEKTTRRARGDRFEEKLEGEQEASEEERSSQTRKKSLEQYSKSVQTRINKLTQSIGRRKLNGKPR